MSEELLKDQTFDGRPLSAEYWRLEYNRLLENTRAANAELERLIRDKVQTDTTIREIAQKVGIQHESDDDYNLPVEDVVQSMADELERLRKERDDAIKVEQSGMEIWTDQSIQLTALKANHENLRMAAEHVVTQSISTPDNHMFELTLVNRSAIEALKAALK